MVSVLFDSMVIDFLVVVAVGAFLVYWYLTKNYDYWKERGVHYLPPQLIFGNIKDLSLFRKSQAVFFQEMYNQLEGHKYGGFFQLRKPSLILRDPEIIKTILVKDFQYLQDRGFPVDPKNNPLSQHLVFLGGRKWRVLRPKLSPTFSSGKMKMMFHAIEECSQSLQKYLEEPAENKEILELKDVLAKFSTDVVGTCAFGLQMNALADPDSEFRRVGRRLFETPWTRQLKRIASFLLPAVAKIFKLNDIDKDIEDFFMNFVRDTVEYRERHNVRRNDFLQLMIDLKNKGKVEDDEHEKTTSSVSNKYADTDLELDHGLFTAQAFVFFVAGFETSSTTMSFALHELAVNPDIQARLRDEIDETLEQAGGRMTYEALMNMKYMDKVVSETLRKFPPATALRREVTVPYTLPDSNAQLDKGVGVIVPVYALHHDSKYFPDPDRFDPERFSEEEKAKRPHYAYLPFGEGPRICIGMRFALMQTKMGLAALLSRYEFHVCERTELPIRFDPRSSVLASYTGTVLRVTNRS